MIATLLDFPSETPETFVPCENCPALQRVERELAQLRGEVRALRCDVGYWKSRHADTVKRNEQLTEELRQAHGQIRDLQGKLFGRKSEKSARGDRSNELFDPEEVAAAGKRRGARPGHAGHGRRDYSHLPVTEEFVCSIRSTKRCWSGTDRENSIRPTKPVGWFLCFWTGKKGTVGGCGSSSARTR